MRSPLEQFTIIPIIRIYNNLFDITINNSTIFMFLTIFFIFTIFFASFNNKLCGSFWYNAIESFFSFVVTQINDILGFKGFKYIPFLSSVFFFILFSNLIGLIPYSFTTTSHFILTLTFSFSFFIGYSIIGFLRHGFHYFSLFVPSGVPSFLIPFIILIEIISYFSRIVSLSVRLAANQIGGHAILKIIAGFGLKISPFFYFLPILVLFLLIGLETAVAVIQAYIFTVLLSTYIKDSEYLH